MSTSGGANAGRAGATVTITAAQMHTLNSDPQTILAAPGAAKMYVVTGVALEYVPALTGFEGTISPQVFYGSLAGDGATKYNQDIGGTAPVAWFADLIPPARNNDVAVDGVSRAGASNAALVFGDSSGGVDVATAGPIVTTTIAAAGLDYVVNDTGTIDGPIYGAAGTYIVTGVGALGVVTGLTVTGAGTGFTLAGSPYATSTGGAQPGIGAGLTVNVTAISPDDGAMYVTPYFSILTLH